MTSWRGRKLTFTRPRYRVSPAAAGRINWAHIRGRVRRGHLKPDLFPKTGSTAPNDCLMFLHRFTSDTRAEIRRWMDDFNNILYERAVAQRIDFVSPASVWTGHELCVQDGEFTNGIKPFFSRVPVDTGSFQPNAQGQQQLASLGACYLNVYPGESVSNLWTTAPAQSGDALVLGKKPNPIWLSDVPGSPGSKRFDGGGASKG
jgi:hypothetical protein